MAWEVTAADETAPRSLKNNRAPWYTVNSALGADHSLPATRRTALAFDIQPLLHLFTCNSPARNLVSE